MEPFRIIPTRRRLRSSRMAPGMNEKGDQLGILDEKPKIPSPHPDPSTLAKEMEEFEKLMQLGNTATEDTDAEAKEANKMKEHSSPEVVSVNITTSNEPYEPDQPTEAPEIPYESNKLSNEPQTVQYKHEHPTISVTSEPYEPEQPTAMGDEYLPEEPTPLDEKVGTRLNSETYEPEQPTEETTELGDIQLTSKLKSEVSEVEADMPQLKLDSEKYKSDNIKNHREDESEYSDNVAKEEHVSESQISSENTEKAAETLTSEGGTSKTEQENLIPEVWLRKKEKKKKHLSHNKHKKPLVEWRLGVIRKDYVRKDLTKFPVDEKLMATTKHKWNNESEVEHLKMQSVVDSDFTDNSEVSGMTSPAYMTCDTDPEAEQDGTEMGMETDQTSISVMPCSRTEDEEKQSASSTCEKAIDEVDVEEAGSDPDKTSEKEGESENKDDKEEVKGEVVEKDETPSRMSTRRSSRRAKAADDDKADTEPKDVRKGDESRRRSLRSDKYRDDVVEEDNKAEKATESKLDKSEEDSGRRRTRRSEPSRNDSDDEGRDNKELDTRNNEDTNKRKSRRGGRQKEDSDDERKAEQPKKSDSETKKEDESRRRTRSDKYKGYSDDDEKKDGQRDKSKDLETKRDDSRRRSTRRSERYRDDSDDERKNSSKDKIRDSDSRKDDDTKRRSSRRSERSKDDSDEDRRDKRENRRRSRSKSRERRRYRDDDSRYSRYDRDNRRERTSDRGRERSEDWRHRDDDRRYDHRDSKEKDDRSHQKGKSEELKEKDEKNQEKQQIEAKVQSEDEKDVKDKSQNKDDGTSGKDQSAKSLAASKASIRMPIKFNFTSRRNTRSTVKPKAGVFDDDENDDDDDDKPLADLIDKCDEKEKDVSSPSSPDNLVRVTRSKSKEGSSIQEKMVTPITSSPPPQTVVVSSENTQVKEEITLRKELRKDVQEAESDSGAEFGLMNFGDEAPQLYPETILHSQLEMEILASAFCSTDTEADTETERPSDIEKIDEEAVCILETLQEQDGNKNYDKSFSTNLETELKSKESGLETTRDHFVEATLFTEVACKEKTNGAEKSQLISSEPSTATDMATILSPEKEEKENVERGGAKRTINDNAVADSSTVILPQLSHTESTEENQNTDIGVTTPDSSSEEKEEIAPETKGDDQSTLTDSNTDTETSIDIALSEDEKEHLKEPVISNTISESKCVDIMSRIEELNQSQGDFSSDLEETKEVEGKDSNIESSSDETFGMEIIDLMEGTVRTVPSSLSLSLPSEMSDTGPEDQSETEDVSNTKAAAIIVENEPASLYQQQAICEVTTLNTTSTVDVGKNATVQVRERGSRKRASRWGEAKKEEQPALMTKEIDNLPSDKSGVDILPSDQVQSISSLVDPLPIKVQDVESGNLAEVSANKTLGQEIDISVHSGPVHADSNAQTKVPSLVVETSATKEPTSERSSKRKRKSRWEPVNVEENLPVEGQEDLDQRLKISVTETLPNNVLPSSGEEVVIHHEESKIPATEQREVPSELPGESAGIEMRQKQEYEEAGRLEIDSGITSLPAVEKDLPSMSEEEHYSSPSKRVKIDGAMIESSEVEAVKQDEEPELGMDLNSQESSATQTSTESSLGSDDMTHAFSLEIDGAGDNKTSHGAVHLESENAENQLEATREKDDSHEESKPSPFPAVTKGELRSREEEGMEEGELAPELKVKTEVEEEWDESCGKEHGEIDDDTSDGAERLRRSKRRLSQNKENIPLGEDAHQEMRQDEREKPKEESRESREERRRLQYEEWGIVDRSKYPKFVELEENLYLTERRRSKAGKEARRMVCCCTTSREERRRGIQACGEDCLNRVLMIECGSRCPCGDYCTNKRFQRRENARVGIFYAEGKGHGLKAKEELKENAFVMEYVGEVLNPSEFRQRAKQYSKGKNLHFYFMALKSDEIIDATEKGNLSRFMNHSCDPNCETQKWTVNGQLRVGFFTKRPVKAGTELTFDYQFEVYGQEAQKCLCGSEKCRGVIGKQKKPKEGKDTTPKRRGSIGEKRRKDSFEDVTLDDEIQQMVEELDECGLQTNDHTIALLRFMVRADQQKQRLALLKILLETRDSVNLKYFVTHHGLRLLWSWMVDLGENPQNLQLQILLTLSHLPIPNKNVLEDSKVLTVIERWARDSAKEEMDQDRCAAIKNESDVDSSSASETPSRSDTPVPPAMAVNFNIDALKSIAEATSSGSDLDSDVAPGKLVESSESPSSPADGVADTCEKPTSSAGDETRTSEQGGEDTSRQPDSASDAKTLSSSDIEAVEKLNSAAPSSQGEEVDDSTNIASANEATKVEDTSENTDVPVSTVSDVSTVDSTGTSVDETKDVPKDSSKEQDKEMSSVKAEQVQSSDSPREEDSSSEMVQAQSEEKGSASPAQTEVSETVIKRETEADDRTCSTEQPSSESEAVKENNEAESKVNEESKNSSSGLANIISTLLESWSELKEIYRIPKKDNDKDKERDRDRDRDHDRDRHRHDDRDRDRRHDRDRDRHRDRDRDRDRSRERDDKHRSRDSERDRDRHRDRDRDRDKDRDRDRDRKDRDKDDRSRRKRSRSRSRERETKPSSWSQESEANSTPPKLRKPWKDVKGKDMKGKESKAKSKTEEKSGAEKEGKKLTKEERRALFEMEVEAKEREEAARKEQELLLMAQWEEREQAQREQMAQFLDPNGFPMDPHAQGMMMNEHGMPIEVLPGHMGMAMGGMPMGEEYMGHPDMQGQYPEHMQHPDMQGHYPPHMQHPHPHPDQMGMEGGYPHSHMHEQMMQPHPEGPPMYDDRGFPIPPQEHMQHPGMEYGMHPDVDPSAMGHHMDASAMAQDPAMMADQLHASMMGQQHVDPHLLGGQPHPGNPAMLPAEHMMQETMVPQQEMHIPQAVGTPQAAAQPAATLVSTQSEGELMPPPSLPAPKKSKMQKGQQKAAKEPTPATYVAPATSSSRASPVLPQAAPASSVAGRQPQGYATQQASSSMVPTGQAPQVMQTPVLPQHPQQAAQTTFTFVTPDGMLVTQTITPLAATDQSMNPHVQQMQQHAQTGIGQQQQQVTESIPSPPAKPKTTKLPPKWKTAQDSEGKTYYYHSVTRQTQWEPPVWDEEEDGPGMDDSQDSGSNTPTYDEKSKKTTTAAADTSSEAAKRLKEAFRSKMSHHVVGYLNVYRKPECKIGRITNTEDFKHLARKLTHGIMAKELKHCRNIEDLEVNENVKHKAKEYIKKYMARFGKVYKKDTVEPDF